MNVYLVAAIVANMSLKRFRSPFQDFLLEMHQVAIRNTSVQLEYLLLT